MTVSDRVEPGAGPGRRRAPPGLVAVAVAVGYALLVIAYFSPVLWGDRVLAFDDALKNYLSGFAFGPQLWSFAKGGYPIYIDIQNMTFLPTKLMFQGLGLLGLPLSLAYNLFVMTPFVLGAVCTHFYVLRFTAGHASAACGGLVFLLSSPMIFFVEWPEFANGAVMLPAIILLLEAMRDRVTLARIAVMALLLATLVLCGHPQMTNAVGVTAALYALVRGLGASCGPLRFFCALGAAAALALGLAAVQLVPTLPAYVAGVGAEWTFEDFNDETYRLADYLRLFFPFITGGGGEAFYQSPEFGEDKKLLVYLGLLPLLLAVIGLSHWDRRPAPFVFWLIAALFCLTLVLGDLTPLSRLVYGIPVINRGHDWARLFFIVSFALALFAGCGAAELFRGTARRRRVVLSVLGLGAAFGLCLILLQVRPDLVAPFADEARRPADWSYAPLENRAILIPSALMLLAAAAVVATRCHPLLMRVGMLVIPLLIVVDLSSFGYFRHWRESAAPVSYILHRPPYLDRLMPELAQGHQRVASYSEEMSDGRLTAHYGQQFERSGLPQAVGRLWGLETLSYPGKWTDRDFDRITEVVDGELLARGYTGLDLLAVRYVLIDSPAELDDVEAGMTGDLAKVLARHPETWRSIGRVGMSWLFENLRALPWAWLSCEARVLTDEEALSAVRSGRLPGGAPFEPSREVILARAPTGAGGDGAAGPAGEVEVLERRAGRYSFRVRANRPCFLVVSDNRYPGWEARRDGTEVEILPANLIHRAVAVPRGESVVEFAFRPLDFTFGAAISGLSLLVMMGLVFAGAIGRQAKPEAAAYLSDY